MLKCTSCENEFDPGDAQDIKVFNSAAGTLSVRCPECKKSMRLNKADSNAVVEAFPELQKDIEQMKAEKETKKFEQEEGGGSDFETKFRNALTVVGMNSSKYEQKIKAVLTYIEPKDKTREWLRYYMMLIGFASQTLVERIVNLTFHDDLDQANVPPYPNPGGSNVGGYAVQQLPGGQVILVPAATQPQPQGVPYPFFINPGGGGGERTVKVDAGEQVVIEELDEEGKVKKRIIKGAAASKVTGDGHTDSTRETLNFLKEMGVIKSQGERVEQPTSSLPPELTDTLTAMSDAIATLSVAIQEGRNTHENPEVKKLTETVSGLTEQVKKYEDEKRSNEMKSVNDSIGRLETVIAGLQNRPTNDATPGNLTDGQFTAHTEHKNLQTITQANEHMIDRLSEPLNKIIENQNRLNSLMMVREIEKQDGVPPGTYMRAMAPVSTPGTAEVKSTVNAWKDKAAQSTKQAQKGAASA